MPGTVHLLSLIDSAPAVGFDGSVEVGGVEIDGALYEGVTLLEELRCEPCDE